MLENVKKLTEKNQIQRRAFPAPMPKESREYVFHTFNSISPQRMTVVQRKGIASTRIKDIALELSQEMGKEVKKKSGPKSLYRCMCVVFVSWRSEDGDFGG